MIDRGLTNFIKYPVLSSDIREHGVVVVVNVLTPLLQLLVNTPVFMMIGLGTKIFIVPPKSILFSILTFTVYVID